MINLDFVNWVSY